MLAFALPSGLGVWAAPAMMRWLRGQAGSLSQPVAAAPVPAIWMRAEAAAADGAAMRASVRVPPQAPATTGQGAAAPAWLDQRLAVRIAGLGLAAMAAWGLWHQLWAQWQAWCA